jgi:hypothetical protein
MGIAVKAGKQMIYPSMTVVVSNTHDQVLAFEMVQKEPDLRHICKILVQALTKPAAGKPHRPTEVQVRPGEPMLGLQPLLADLDIGFKATEELELIDQVFEDLAEQLAGQREPGILDMPSMTPRMVKGLFEAADVYYRQAPWKKVGERTIEIACPKFESSPWYAVMMGQAGITAGLVLYDSLATLNRIRQEDVSEEESGRLTSALAVVFGEKEDLPEADLEAVEQYGWKVAGARAYPAVYRKEPGTNMRPPLAWEVQLLEGCLRAVPDFVKARKPSQLMALEVSVTVSTGELPMKLAWVDE